ncbi:MAG: SDR family oxidoreductase, partial [Eubacterium sp.]|nr:SDR family oxidoreductase [Eubacterium sp.]
EYLGRIDTQVKLRGFRIELGEIENRAVRYAGIREACAEVRQEQLVLYYTLQEKIQSALLGDGKASSDNTLQMKAGSAEAEGTDSGEGNANVFREGLRTFLSEQLADYMVPTVYMELDTMPLTPAGKINRKALPEPERVNRGELILPQTPLQEQLCSIFREELTLEEVGINENFFEIGGNSIRAMKVLLQMMVKGLPLNYQDLYNHPRVDELEQLIYEKQSRKKEGTRDGSLSGGEGAEEKTLTCLSRNRVEYLEDLAFRELGNILLVGATGFLGAHLLKKLLDETRGTIYCLIRPGRLGAVKRLHEIMFYYFEDTFDHFLGDRLVLIEGDILSDEIMEKVGTYDIQTVINCAADVRHFADIDSLMLANVKLVDRLIELCIEKNARLIHTSTTSVAGSVAAEKGTQVVLREDKLELGQYTEDNGYVHTKFIAEKHVLTAVEERGLDAKIMRLGNLMSRTTDGEFQMNFNTNNFFRTLWAFAELECIPFSILTDEEEISPVDEVAEAIVRLSGTDSRFTVFHPYNCHRIRLGDIVYAMERAGYSIRPVNDDEFRIRVHEGIADPDTGVVLSPLFMYDTDRDDQMINIQTDNDFTTMALYRLGFNWSMTDMNYLEEVIRNVGELRL